MKKLCSLIAAAALMLSVLVSPVIALTDAQTPTAQLAQDKANIKLIKAPSDAAPMDAETLDEALNVSGGQLAFFTMEYPDYGMYSWLIEGDYTKAGNSGIDGDPNITGVSQSQVYMGYDFAEGQGVSFRFKVSCEDVEETDWFAVFIDNAPAAFWYGELDWTDHTIPVSAGEHTITWCYNKDAQNSAGADIAYLDDVEIVEAEGGIELVHSEELDAALNSNGGELEFMTAAEAANGYFPWAAVEDYAKSTNEGVDAESNYNPPSISTVSTTVEIAEGEILRFLYRVSSEKDYDLFRFYVDGERIEQWSGIVDWSVYNYAPTPGTHEFKWEYDKDWSGAQNEDAAYLDDIYIGTPEAVTGVEIQPTATVAGYRRVQLVWNVLPDAAFNRNVTFTSSDESIAAVDENGIVTGITQGEAIITVTTEEGGFSDECIVTVTEDIPPVDIYGFMFSRMLDDDEGWYRDEYSWCTFQDTNPAEVTYLGTMPEDEDPLVLCAALVDGIIYGYDSMGRFFKIDFEALQWTGELSIEYFDCNATGDESFYPTEMAYDYSTGTMYIINGLADLWQIDMETGDVLLDTGLAIEGDVPDYDGVPSTNAFAIDYEGNAYIMLAGFGLVYGGNGCSRLARLDLETGEFTVIGQTTELCYQEQSMCFDYNSGRLYWAQFATSDTGDPMALYVVDTETAELEPMGKITEFGAEILGMFIPFDEDAPIDPTPVPPTGEPVTGEPITDEPITNEPTTDEPATNEPSTDEPTEPTPIPTDTPNPPATGTIALVGMGIAAIIAGTGIVLFRKEEE